MYPSTPSIVVATLSLPFLIKFVSQFLRSPPRQRLIAPNAERVVVLGASSGVGSAIAHLYARRGARVCIVGRRAPELENVKRECDSMRTRHGDSKQVETEPSGNRKTLAIAADFTKPADMVELSNRLEDEWGGFDTLVVSAGVSALLPLLSVAGIERQGKTFSPAQATVQGVERTASIASAALQGNYIGPLIAAVTMIPLLTRASTAPAVLLVSSVAAVIPAPTRSLYASTKGASLLLYQALAMEHPEIVFTFFLPGTIEGGFRASAVDGGSVREADPNASGLKRGDVARRCIQAIDLREKTVFMGGIYRWAHLLYWLWPTFVEGKAKKKYNFSVDGLS